MRKAVKNKKKINLIIIVSLVAVLLTVLLIFIIKPFYSYSSRIKNVKKVTNDGYPVMGWIRVQGTNIDYPVLYSMDSNFPLEDVDIDFAWTNSDSMSLNPRVIVIYGAAPDAIFDAYRESGIEILQFDSDYAVSRRKEGV